MIENSITSEPAQKPAPKTKKHKMSAAGRKAVSEAAKARWAERKAATSASGFTADTPTPIPQPVLPAPPSPAVLKLQEQVVELVSQRHQARTMLNEAHNAYLAAQARFQAAENELKGIEAEVQYRISLIAQLENRQPAVTGAGYTNSPVLQMPGGMAAVSSEPAPQAQQQRRSQENFAVGSADDLRRDMRSMM